MPYETLRGMSVPFAVVLAERRAEQCRVWNARRAHQVEAGKARAAQMTPEERAKGGYHSSAKQGAQWRAQQGLAPRRVSDAMWLTVEDIRAITGETLSAETKRRILRAWRAGVLLGVGYWLRFPTWADELDQRLDAEERGVMQPELLPMPDGFLYLPDPSIGSDVSEVSAPGPHPLPPIDSLGEDIAAWVRLVDQLEAAQVSTSVHNPTAERSVTSLVEAMEAGLHTLQPDERVWARDYLWLRDHPDEPLPPAADRAWWSLCPCRLCRLDRRRAAFERSTQGMSDEARRQLLRVAAPQFGPAFPLSA